MALALYHCESSRWILGSDNRTMNGSWILRAEECIDTTVRLWCQLLRFIRSHFEGDETVLSDALLFATSKSGKVKLLTKQGNSPLEFVQQIDVDFIKKNRSEWRIGKTGRWICEDCIGLQEFDLTKQRITWLARVWESHQSRGCKRSWKPSRGIPCWPGVAEYVFKPSAVLVFIM